MLFIGRDETTIIDPMIVNTMLTLIKNLERNKETTRIVLDLAQKVDFGNDFEGQLNFYSDIRAVFGYTQEITIDIVILELFR